MRVAQREVKDGIVIREFLQRERVGFLGLTDGAQPYVVPMNFVLAEQTVYLHTARDGRKWQVLQHNPRASFAVARWKDTLEDPVPCRIDTAYFSVLGEGVLRIVEDLGEETSALRLLLAKYLPSAPRLTERSVQEYRSSLGNRVGVLALEMRTWHAKANGEAVGGQPAEGGAEGPGGDAEHGTGWF